MDLSEVNIQLKEELEVLEKQYCQIMKEFQSLIWMPSLIHGNLKLIELMCSQQVLAQQGEKCSITKSESVEEFAKYLGMMVGISVKHLEEKYNVR